MLESVIAMAIEFIRFEPVTTWRATDAAYLLKYLLSAQ